MLAIGVLLSWEIIALAVVGLILFYKVLDLSIDAGRAWWHSASGPGEDMSANKERER